MLQEFVDEVKKLTKDSMSGMHTAMPGTIVAFNAETGLASVQPVVKFKLPNGKIMAYPVVSGVPVLIPQASGQTATIAYPVSVGDGCLIIVSERSIEYWLYGQETDTDLSFDLTDSICIPGLFPLANPVLREACEKNAAIIDVGGTRIAVRKEDVEITAPKVVVTGDLSVSGNVTAKNL